MPKYKKNNKPTPIFLEYAIGPVFRPNENDVIIGRGFSLNPGNVKFRKLLDSKRTEYQAIGETKRKFPKLFFIADIVDGIRRQNPPGRFLVRREGYGGLYYDIGDEAAWIKVQRYLQREFQTEEAKQQQQQQKKKQQQQQATLNPISQQGTTGGPSVGNVAMNPQHHQQQMPFVGNVAMNPQHYQLQMFQQHQIQAAQQLHNQQQMNPFMSAMFRQQQIQAQQGMMTAGPCVGNQQGMVMAGGPSVGNQQGMMGGPLTGAVASPYIQLPFVPIQNQMGGYGTQAQSSQPVFGPFSALRMGSKEDSKELLRLYSVAEGQYYSSHDLRDNDVICGVGKPNYGHVGNQQFRSLAKSKRDEYNDPLNSRHKKALIALGIVRTIRRSKGRFLEKVQVDGHWFWKEIGDEKARQKSIKVLAKNYGTKKTKRLQAQNTKQETKTQQQGMMMAGASVGNQQGMIQQGKMVDPLIGAVGEKKKAPLPHQYPPMQVPMPHQYPPMPFPIHPEGKSIGPYSALMAASGEKKKAPLPLSKQKQQKKQQQKTLVDPISQQGTTGGAFVGNVAMNPQHYQQQMNPFAFAMFQQQQIQAQQAFVGNVAMNPQSTTNNK